MSATIHVDAPPIRVDEYGVWRVGKSRLMVDLVIDAYKDGQTPEQIVDCYDVLALADAYALVAYYLRYRDEVDAYLAENERIGEENRKKTEAAQDPNDPLLKRLREIKRQRGLS